MYRTNEAWAVWELMAWSVCVHECTEAWEPSYVLNINTVDWGGTSWMSTQLGCLSVIRKVLLWNAIADESTQNGIVHCCLYDCKELLETDKRFGFPTPSVWLEFCNLWCAVHMYTYGHYGMLWVHFIGNWSLKVWRRFFFFLEGLWMKSILCICRRWGTFDEVSYPYCINFRVQNNRIEKSVSKASNGAHGAWLHLYRHAILRNYR